MRKAFMWIGAALVILAAIAWLAMPSKADPILQGKAVTEYKSMGCGCCGVYGSYIEGRGMKVQIVDLDDPSKIKEQYNIPAQLRSCHTTIVDGYFVEGHVPAEAIAKMLREKPDIAGIAMGGMPPGSPGMPGAKEGPFIVYAVNKDGTYNEYMRI
jgi:hypothetical protein